MKRPELDLKVQLQKLDGRIHDDETIYRQPPSGEVDEAWDRVAARNFEIINVTAEDVRRSGKDPAGRIRWVEGVDSFPAQIDVFHQIHCLNEIRKEMYSEHYYPESSKRPGNDDHFAQAVHNARRQHKMHCLHMILQNIMCHSDIDIVTNYWAPSPSFYNRTAEPFADFSILKRCRDFEGLLSWVHDNAVEKGQEKIVALKKPEGAELIAGDGYY